MGFMDVHPPKYGIIGFDPFLISRSGLDSSSIPGLRDLDPLMHGHQDLTLHQQRRHNWRQFDASRVDKTGASNKNVECWYFLEQTGLLVFWTMLKMI